MILGRVNDRKEAIVQFAVLGEDQRLPLSIRGVIDTGYTKDLS